MLRDIDRDTQTQAPVLMYQADLNRNFKKIFYSRLFSVSFIYLLEVSQILTFDFKWYQVQPEWSNSDMMDTVYYS